MNTKSIILWTNLAYSDYIAARVLLNNNIALPAAIFAGTAIEKYIKVILIILGKDISKLKVHLDKLDKLKELFQETEYEELFTDHLDDSFLGELGKAYSFRYYDNIKHPISFGFFLNQLLGELDHTIAKLDHLIDIFDGNNQPVLTAYKRAVKTKDEHVMPNNFLLNGINKTEFMNRKSFGYVHRYNSDTINAYIGVTKYAVDVPPYTGKIFLIRADEK